MYESGNVRSLGARIFATEVHSTVPQTVMTFFNRSALFLQYVTLKN